MMSMCKCISCMSKHCIVHRYVYCVCIFKLQLTAKKRARGTRRCWHHLYLTRMHVNHISASSISVCYPYCQVMACSIGFTDYLYILRNVLHKSNYNLDKEKQRIRAFCNIYLLAYYLFAYIFYAYLISSYLFMYLNAYLRFTNTILLARVAIFFNGLSNINQYWDISVKNNRY